MSKLPLLQRYDEEDRAAFESTLERVSYLNGVLGKAFQIAADNDGADYDTNNLYDLIREGVKAKKDLMNERERCAKIAEDVARQFDRDLQAAYPRKENERYEFIMSDEERSRREPIALAAIDIAKKIRSGE